METEKLFEYAKAMSKKTLEEQGHHIPMFLADIPAYGITPVACPWGSKKEKHEAVRALGEFFRRVGVTRFIGIIESWMVIPKTKLEYADAMRVVPSEHPDRIEALYIMADEETRANPMVGYWIITRDADNKPHCSEWVGIEQTEGEGIFDDLIGHKLVDKTTLKHAV
jgi:hypothetical protein